MINLAGDFLLINVFQILSIIPELFELIKAHTSPIMKSPAFACVMSVFEDKEKQQKRGVLKLPVLDHSSTPGCRLSTSILLP
jgi:hypothetical protein